MMMHFLDEIDTALEAKIAAYLRAHQAEHGGWPLYHDGALNISCSVKVYFALEARRRQPRRAAHGAGTRRPFSSAAAPRAATSSRALRWRCSSRFPGVPCPTFPSKSCCCRAGFRSISIRCRIGRARSWCRCSFCVPHKARARNPRQVAYPRAVHDAAANASAGISGCRRTAPGLWRRRFCCSIASLA